MHTISSEAGTRLAKAKAAMDVLDTDKPGCQMTDEEGHMLAEASWEWIQASHAVAVELIASGFHRMGEE